MPPPTLVNVLARALMAGPALDDSSAGAAASQVTERLSATLGKSWPWLLPLAESYARSFVGRTRPRHREVVQFLLEDPGFRGAAAQEFNGAASPLDGDQTPELISAEPLEIASWLAPPPTMSPVAAAADWKVPVIETPGDLTNWLGLNPGELEWYADLKGLGSRNPSQNNRPQLRHYHYRILAKSSGNIRLIEAPKSRLRYLHRRILTAILDPIPVHPAVHGFVRGRSIKTFATPHIGQAVVLRMDLKDFFPSFAAARIQTFFRTIGYPEPVADLLGGICTNSAPRNLWKAWESSAARQHVKHATMLYSRPHLPQGAPTSPSLANLCTYRVDCRLSGLAKSADAQYTRYADDLAFSGGAAFARHANAFSASASAILLEEGLHVNHRKTRIMRRAGRQHLAGLVTNELLNIPRYDFDRLKAILHNCVRFGPESQNRDDHPQFRSHLEGRVSFVEMVHKGKGKQLSKILERIEWD